jgi:putative transposase
MSRHRQGPLADVTLSAHELQALVKNIGQMGSVKVSSMRTLKNMLVERYGDRVREVDPRFTSQDCSQCGHRSKESWSYAHGRFGQCPACGHREDRDVNAARNIASKLSISKAA